MEGRDERCNSQRLTTRPRRTVVRAPRSTRPSARVQARAHSSRRRASSACVKANSRSRACRGHSQSEARSYPCTDVLDEESLVHGKPFRVEARRILVEPQGFVGHAVRADYHRRRYVGRHALRNFGVPCVFDSSILIEACYEEFGEPSADVRRQLEEFRENLKRIRMNPRSVASRTK